MREIKFKAKRVDNGEWVSGDLIHYEKEFKKRLAIVDWNEDKDGYREVHPETVCQYTGLKDKNGKEIYEGDITKSVNKECVIIWYHNQFAARYKNSRGVYIYLELRGNQHTVIGNIHNKEATNDN